MKLGQPVWVAADGLQAGAGQHLQVRKSYIHCAHCKGACCVIEGFESVGGPHPPAVAGRHVDHAVVGEVAEGSHHSGFLQVKWDRQWS